MFCLLIWYEICDILNKDLCANVRLTIRKLIQIRVHDNSHLNLSEDAEIIHAENTV